MVWKIFKPWTWIQRKPKKEEPPEVEPIKLYPSKNAVLTTTETDLFLKPCKVHDDHKIEFKGNNGKNKTVTIAPERPAHIFSFNPTIFFRTKLQKLLAFMFLPRFITFRTYTIRAEGEITHDPHFDGLDDEEKMKLESVLKLQGTAAKAAIADNIMAGLKDKKDWIEFIPYLVIAVIVLFFLLSFQILPNV